MFTDPIADFLTRIRNAQQAKHPIVDIPFSKIKLEITKILDENGYILSHKVIEDKFKTLRIALKYDKRTDSGTIVNLQRVSRPGLRRYSKPPDIPRVIDGLGICILSTSKGIMTDKKAKEMNIGGELLCEIY